MKRVAVITSVHKRFDTRIWQKQIVSLAEQNDIPLEIDYFVMDGKGNSRLKGINIYDLKFTSSRFFRIIFSWLAVLSKVRLKKYKVLHFHDPELFLLGYVASFFVETIIYDAHEDIYSTIMSRRYLPKITRPFIMLFVKLFINFFLTRIRVIAATDKIYSIFKTKHKITVKNYAKYSNHTSDSILIDSSKNIELPEKYVVFHGGITELRGASVMRDAIELCKSETHLVLAGVFRSNELKSDIIKSNKVKYLGWLEFNETEFLLKNAIAGLVVYQKDKNHIESEPNKLFEYMASGIPTICSNFTLWKKLIKDHHAGICVSPTSAASIANAIDYLASNDIETKKMGSNAAKACSKKYSWQSQIPNLLQFYKG